MLSKTEKKQEKIDYRFMFNYNKAKIGKESEYVH